MSNNQLFNGDCIEMMRSLGENSVDCVVTDPPYGLGFMGKEWDTFDKSQFGIAGNEGENDLKVKKNFSVLPRYNTDGLYDFSLKWAAECLRVLKPGGHLLSFAGTRTHHKICSAIEDAGFEIRDMVAWTYSQGFPKSLNIGKAVDKIQGNEREIVVKMPVGYAGLSRNSNLTDDNWKGKTQEDTGLEITQGSSEFEGYGTALKPAFEPVTVARKPISEKTVAANCLRWGTGGLNIDGCRVQFASDADRLESTAKSQLADFGTEPSTGNQVFGDYSMLTRMNYNPPGRFPANFIHDGSPEVVACLPNDTQRFFYAAKASRSERNMGCEELEEKETNRYGDFNGTPEHAPKKDVMNKNFHPTVKPIAVMEYLIRLVSRPGATVLDPFLGSGTTGIAAKRLGCNFIGIELDPEYFKIASSRINHL